MNVNDLYRHTKIVFIQIEQGTDYFEQKSRHVLAC